MTDLKGKPVNAIDAGESLVVEIEAVFSPEFSGEPSLGIVLKRSDDLVICSTTSSEHNTKLESLGENRFRGRLVLENIPLMDGEYSLIAVALDSYVLQTYDVSDIESSFTVKGASPNPGIVNLPHRWTD